MATIEAIDPARPNCPLLPADECQAVIEAAERVAGKPTPEQATALARSLLGVYRRDDVNDPATYALAISATLAEFPAYIAERVASPVHGLPARLKFLPSIAEVREALETEDRRQRLIVARARWMLQERDKREAETKRRREIEQQRVDPAKVQEIVNRARAKAEVTSA